MSRYRLNRNDEIGIFFKDENSAPYRMFGKYQNEDDENIRIIGTVGDQIGREFFVPKREIKLIEVVQRRKEDY